MDNKEIWLQVLAIIKENTTAANMVSADAHPQSRPADAHGLSGVGRRFLREYPE